MAKDLTPSMTAGINPQNVAGIVTELGGKTSHSAILARALEIPAVVAVSDFLTQVKNGDSVILDGDTGIVYVNPDTEIGTEYSVKRDAFLAEKKELEQYIGKPTITKDGVTVELVANIGKPKMWKRYCNTMVRAWACSVQNFCLWIVIPCLRKMSSLRLIRRWRKRWPASR